VAFLVDTRRRGPCEDQTASDPGENALESAFLKIEKGVLKNLTRSPKDNKTKAGNQTEFF
jgi:hypothetical protein